uniref:Uncharacterized protein n=1 Tax=Vitis vinifera TaxID=29760 RepID=A5B0F6_VITVI|nr:hypothetical protein VITISV_040581 [Vitis vinifera]
MKNRSFEVLCHKQIWNARSMGVRTHHRRAAEHGLWQAIGMTHVSHFWSTFWSPIYACYMSFRSSGSQKSNASNSVQFGVEIKELQPLQADHSKLKEEFWTALRNDFAAILQCCGISPEVSRYLRHVGSRTPQSESQLRSAAKSAFCCEVISQPFCASAKSRRPRFDLRNGP